MLNYMRKSLSGLLLASIVAQLGACSDDDGGDDGGGDQAANTSEMGALQPGNGASGCAGFCARTLNCNNDPAPSCLSSCQTSASLCPAESTAVLQCAAPRPNTDFHCDAQVGVTTINEDVCTMETDTLLDCVIAAAF